MLTLRNSTWVLYVGQWWAVKWFTILNKTIILLAMVFDIWTKFYNFVFFLSSRSWKPVPKDTLRKVLHYLFFDIFKFLVLSERQTVVLNLYFEIFNIFKTKTQYVYTWIICGYFRSDSKTKQWWCLRYLSQSNWRVGGWIKKQRHFATHQIHFERNVFRVANTLEWWGKEEEESQQK